jgi:hypothetical protein
MTETPVYERRSILKLMLGIGTVAVAGGVMMLPGEALAAPGLPAKPQTPEVLPEPVQDIAQDSEKPEALETQYSYRRRRVYRRPVYVRRRVYVAPRRRVYVRPRRRVYVRPRRRVYVRRRYVRYY